MSRRRRRLGLGHTADDLPLTTTPQIGIFSSLPPYPYLTSRYGVGSVCKAWRALIISSGGKLWSSVAIVEGHGPAVQSSKLRTQIYPPISFAHGLPPDLSGGSRSSDSAKRTRPPTTRCNLRRPVDRCDVCMMDRDHLTYGCRASRQGNSEEEGDGAGARTRILAPRMSNGKRNSPQPPG